VIIRAGNTGMVGAITGNKSARAGRGRGIRVPPSGASEGDELHRLYPRTASHAVHGDDRTPGLVAPTKSASSEPVMGCRSAGHHQVIRARPVGVERAHADIVNAGLSDGGAETFRGRIRQ